MNLSSPSSTILNIVHFDPNKCDFKVPKITLGFTEACGNSLKSLDLLNFIKWTDKFILALLPPLFFFFEV